MGGKKSKQGGGKPAKATKGSGSEYSTVFSVVMIGELGVGKSSLLIRYADDSFIDSNVATVGSDSREKLIKVDKSSTVKMTIGDTGGAEKFRQMTQSYFAGIHGALVIFDMSNMASLEATTKHFKNAKEQVSQLGGVPLIYVLVGNKSDAPHAEGISEKAKQIAATHKAQYFEVSAKTGQNVSEPFQVLAESLLKKMQNEKEGLG